MKLRAPVVAVVAVLLAGCAGSSATPMLHPSGLTTGGTLTMAVDADMVLADPSLVTDKVTELVANQVVEGLLGLRPGTVSEVVPVLATDLPAVSKDGLTYTFKLRGGVKFHDGTTLDAGGVKANFDRWNSFPAGDLQNHASYFKLVFGGFGDAGNLAGVDAPDKQTVVLHLRHAQSNLPIALANPAFGILSPSSIKAEDGNNPKLADNALAQGQGGLGKTMVGTGPFMFKEWAAGDHVTLVKNPSYWNPAGEPYLDQVVFKVYASAVAKLAALQDGSVDMIESADPTSLATIGSDSKLRVLDRGESCDMTQLAMNDVDTIGGQTNLLASDSVRFAISAAVNRLSYVKGIYADAANVADNWLPPKALYYKPEYLSGYNLNEARQYLADAGLANAKLNVDLVYPTGADAPMPDAKGLATAVASDLGAAGFSVNLKEEAFANLTADAAAGKLQMWLQSVQCPWASADGFINTALFHYTNGAAAAPYNYASQDFETAVTTALAATDPATLQADWQKVEDIVAGDMPTVPLLHSRLPAAASASVRGFVGSGEHYENLSSVWLAR